MSRRSDDRRVALVTGANRGIGLAVCRQLAERGVVVLLGARDAAAGDAAARTLQADGLEVRPIVIDTDHRETFDAAREAIEREFGKLDILVNNIGIGCDWAYTAANVPMPLLRNTFEINFFSVVELTQRLLPLVRKSPAGRIVNQSSAIGSLAGHATPESWAMGDRPLAYSASKTALNAFTVHLACALRIRRSRLTLPIRASSRPTPIRTGSSLRKRGRGPSVALALLPDDGPTGGFFHLGEAVPW